VVSGSATVTNPGSANVTVTQQSDKAIINWSLFNVGANERVQFVQPNSGSVILNRVIGGFGASIINGTVDANGRVFIVNRDGILIGAGAVINTSGFLATTHDIRNDDLMAGRFNFGIAGRPDASIVNLGTITANNGGFAALVAPGVRNSGTITATMGNVTLASGNGFSLDFYGDKLVTLSVGDSIASSVKDVATGLPLKALVGNDGTIRANGGRVELTAAAARQVVDAVINTTGVIEANSIGTKNGMIVLGAATGATKPAGAPAQIVKVSGTLQAAGRKKGTKGGTIVVTGENIQLAGATIDASGRTGGGKVLIGGDWGGGRPDTSLVSNASAVLETFQVATATIVSVDAATRIDASAKQTGNGGKVIVWSDQYTSFAGTILALGGKTLGDGGFAEVSSKGVLNYTGVADLRATNGKFGALLLDPYDVEITTVDQFNSFSNGTFTATGPTSFISSSTLQNALALGNVLVNTGAPGSPPLGGQITIVNNVTWSANTTLTLSAFANILFYNASITNTGSGNLILRPDNTGTGVGSVLFSGTAGVNLASGFLSIYYNPGSYQFPTDFSPNVTTAAGHFTSYMLVNDARNLRDIDTNLAGNYALGRNIEDFTSFPNFSPIGDISHPFTGKFDGLGNTISNLTIAPNNSTLQSIGLFSFIGSTGIVSNLNFSKANVSANAGFDSSIYSQWVGILAGSNAGTITNVTASGTVNGLNLVGVIAGGLVGQNGTLGPGGHPGTITASSANVIVTVGDGSACPGPCNFNAAGGLVGANVGNSTISNSHASGDVTGGTFVFIGGLAGYNGFNIPANASGAITNSYATGNVTMTGPVGAAGGLVGTNSSGSVITDAQALGSVTALANQTTSSNFLSAGGLVGQNSGTIAGTTTPPTTVTACVAGASWACAGGPVSVGSSAHAGGLVGQSDGIIRNTFATGNVTGATGLGNLNAGDDQTTLGGLVGSNSGLVENSFARGDVGTLNVSGLAVGGLVGDNAGTIRGSVAFGTVQAGDQSVAGGLVGNNSLFDPCGCVSYGDGSAYFNTAFITGSTAFGNVTVGSMSIAGGFVGANDGPLVTNVAHGNVLGAGNTFLGGFVGVAGYNDGLGTISFATASGSVTSTGPNSTIGGLVGGNMSPIVNSSASGPVTGTSDSFLGGLVGINVGKITDSTTAATATVTAPGANNIMGGLVGLNLGWIDPSTSAGNVTGGPNNIVGGFVGANTAFTNFSPNLIAGSTFPVGTISPGSFGTGTATGGPGSTVNPQVASNNPNGSAPAYPSPIQSCDAAGCVILRTGTFGPAEPTPDQGAPVISPQLVVTQQLTQDTTGNKQTDPVVTQTTTTTPGTPGGPKPGAPAPGPGAPPPWFGPNAVLGSGLPPITETRYAGNEIVLQLRSDLTPEQFAALQRDFGLTVIASQELGLLGRTIVRFQITNGRSVRDLIPLMEKLAFTAQAQPVYLFELTQAQAQPQTPAGNEAPPKGDSAQYIVSKLRLPDVHLLATGKGVLVAVVDSTIDVNHPDLAGVIAERFDTAGSELTPHAHGTGMAGAIASHKRLLGVAPNARLLAIQAFGVNSGGAQGTSLAIVRGLNWAVERGAKVINMSFAGPKDPILEQAIKAMREKGIVLIAAAGNAGPKSPPLFPGADPNVIAVSATDADDGVYKNANRGKYIAIAAPGVDILVPAPDGGYQLTTGTSVAAAHVSGVAALLLERNPNLKPDDIRRILTTTATKLKGLRPEDVGAGLIDPYDALLKLAPKTATVQ
jgi:filamentous hemagglutinin family protein